MKLLIFADPHWCSYSSIVRSRGNKYSTRLENLIATMNWIEDQAESNYCDAIICLGDFFDRPELDAESITALQEINWCNKPHYFIVGNHEMGTNNLDYSSSHLFDLNIDFYVINKPTVHNQGDTSIVYLPYILESDRKPLVEYINKHDLRSHVIIMSHNDIAGINMGKFISQDGFNISEIEDNCDLFINGHIHNENDIGKKIINLGNITGQNFSEDAFKYSHNILILDTVSRNISTIENPNALNFYKLDFTNYTDSESDLRNIVSTIDNLKNNSILTVKIKEKMSFCIKDLLASSSNILTYRLIIDYESSDTHHIDLEDSPSVNHIDKFKQYILSNIAGDNIINEELQKIVG